MLVIAISSPFFSRALAADEGAQQGILATVYDNWTWDNLYNNAPPVPPVTPVVGTYVVDRIAQYLDWQPVFGLYDDFVIHYQGTITLPAGGSVRFLALADDGTILYVDDQLTTHDWYDKGNGGTVSEPILFEAGQAKSFDLWYYENGGGAFVELWWSVDDAPWEIIPPTAFLYLPPPPPTTTTEAPTTTTEPPTTTTEPPPPTTTQPPPPPPTTTTEPPSATTPENPPPQTTLPVAPPTTPPTTTTPPAPPISDVLESISSGKTLTPSEAVAVLTNPAIFDLPKDDLETLFSSVPFDKLSLEQEAALVETLTIAPTEVKETFEDMVDVYGEGLDDYVPVGSSIDVGTRRSIIAVTTVLSTAAASLGPSGPAQGGATSGSPGDANKAARRSDEEEEEAGGLEGPEDREKNTHTRNSIFTYGENGMKKFSILGFIKKFLKETAALSFTFAGSAIMFVTLSGETQRIAIVATATAVLVHYIYVMLENDEE
jgi:hypothetical protein